MSEFKRDEIKYVRDKAKAKYNKGTECEICGSKESLDFHHYYTLTPLYNKWKKDNKIIVNTEEDILSVRDAFIEAHLPELYEHTVTLCHDHHMALHAIYGKDPALHMAKKEIRWVAIQRGNIMGLLDWTVNKLNPAQRYISNEGKTEASSETPTYSYQQCYEQLEIVNRAVNMIVDDVAAIKISVGDPLSPSASGVRKKTLDKVLNREPNPHQDIDSFRRSLVLDLILDGNIFIYFDGAHMYHLPAIKMTVVSDPKTYVAAYKFDGGAITYTPEEIIHIKDNSYKTLFRGSSRLEPALRTMRLIIEMRMFQDNFFKNGAVPGLVLKTEATLNQRLKDRLTAEWSNKYRPNAGGRRPVILDGGLEIDAISATSFKDLDFQNAILECEKVVIKALGVPPVLMDSGNNANLRPNHRLYYLETIIPIVNKMNSALQRFFGFEIYEDITYIEALRPELSDQASYLQSLVNGGIMYPNEAREQLGLAPDTDPESSKLRIPANIAGSAVNPSEGGRPTEGANSGK